MPDQLDQAELDARAEALEAREDALRRRELAAAEADAAQAAERERRIAALPVVRAERERQAAQARAKAAGPQRVRFGGMARSALFTSDETPTLIPELEGFAVTEDEDKRFVEVVGLPGELETFARSLGALEPDVVGARAAEAGRRAARCVYTTLKIPAPSSVRPR